MSGNNSIDAVKRKIKVLQQQADEAEERAEILQRQVEVDKTSREQVKSIFMNQHSFRLFDKMCTSIGLHCFDLRSALMVHLKKKQCSLRLGRDSCIYTSALQGAY